MLQETPLYDAVQEIEYLDKVVQESLRLYPAIAKYVALPVKLMGLVA